MNEERHEHSTTDDSSLEEAVGALFTVGRLWASHGLRAAEAALQTSAETLRVTAEALADASERIGAEEEAPAGTSDAEV